MSIRYFIQGSVRKFGDQIKITSALLDIESGDHLWQDSMKGTMQDIFDIQEKVAEKVVEGLKVHLAADEKKKLAERGTDNVEAYEYSMRADELFDLFTREGFLQAISLCDLAMKLDPLFVDAIIGKASAIIQLFQSYERDPTLLREAELLLQKVEELKPGGWQVHDQLAQLYLLEGRAEDAEREHQEHIAKDDGSTNSQAELGYFCFATKKYSKAFEYYEASLKIDLTNPIHLWNVIINAHNSCNSEGLDRWSALAISAFQKQLRLHPEDAYARFKLAATYFWSNPPRRTESLKEINLLESLPNLDFMVLNSVALVLTEQGEVDRAIEVLRKSISKGFANLGRMRARDADSDFAPLYGHPAFEALMKEVEEKIAGEKSEK
jgi:adenylate cyclase